MDIDSLQDLRDVTIIETPPRDRHPIQTYVGLYDEGMVTRAIEREIERGGQVYYLHNRVETIDKVAMRLRELMPTVRFAVAHGQPELLREGQSSGRGGAILLEGVL